VVSLDKRARNVCVREGCGWVRDMFTPEKSAPREGVVKGLGKPLTRTP